MRKLKRLKYLKITSTILTVFTLLQACTDIVINQVTSVNEVSGIVVPDIILPDESENDPKQTGVDCSGVIDDKTISDDVGLIDPFEIPNNLPTEFDLSSLMPPVRSQGGQGSCVAWATAYYLKSYQEKVQNQYEYESYNDVMSPAFVYNQSKANESCGSGSAIVNALNVLKTKGCNTWLEFPYTDKDCSRIPSDSLYLLAESNRIKDFFLIGVSGDNIDPNYTVINIIKTLIYQKNPIVISMEIDNNFKSSTPRLVDGTYLYTEYNSALDSDDCGHAILITGYDDQKNAFKIINQWGTSWANGGYAWVSYDFFLPSIDTNFKEGLTGVYVAYDED